MDYVVFGIGFGASILVLGLLLRDFGPRLRYRASRDGGDVLSAEELVGKVSWSRFCAALGSVLALAGAAFLLVTAVSMFLVVSDDTGLWVMAVSFGVLVLLMLYWTWAYFHRFGSYGILPERVEEPEPAPAAPRPRQAPATAQTAVAAGPAVPAPIDTPAGDDEEPARPVAAENATGVPSGTIEVETGEVDEEPRVEAEVEERRRETPEERLAHAESPIDHGSAEGDLDLAASRPRRPSMRAGRSQAPGVDTADAERRPYAGPPVPSDLEAEG